MKYLSVNTYPMLSINTSKLLHNAEKVLQDCKKQGIELAAVIKGFNGIEEAALQFSKAGYAQIASSRIDQIIDARNFGIKGPFMLIRIPMLSEIKNLVEYVDISLNSEISIIEAINDECIAQKKLHGIVLMVDLGDLREGFWDKSELIRVAQKIENNMLGLKLMGVGTNLGCYGSIKPTEEKMNELCQVAEEIERIIGRRLEIISGGATSSYPLVLNRTMPKKINHLRIGEGIILAYDLQDLWGLDMAGLYQDVFTFKAEVVEIKEKPTHPVGEIFIDGFGHKPAYEDRGIRKRAILATGKLDYAIHDKIFPKNIGMEVIGSSSDHTIVDIQDCKDNLTVGDILEFNISYPSLMYLTNSRYVNIEIVEGHYE
ncbi:MAG: alanine/ornithine racemase family PLP-dependent enzyme [Peptostreptococcaceae bacterium]|nr:alanine/ornithine racemase family PLP-dependent enzyme [Peptostreptococcaceae bacterium]